MIAQLLLPTLILMAAAVAVTRGVEAVMPESVPGLVATGLVSALILWLAASLGFAGLYLLEDGRIAALFGQRPAAGLRHFLGLGAQAAVIWAPLSALVVVTAPRRWKTAVW